MKRVKVHQVDSSKAEFSGPMSNSAKEILLRRGLFSDEDLDHRLSAMPDPALLFGLSAAVDLIVEALVNKTKILILGDYDADGATSTALAILLLRSFGSEQVAFLVPNRFEYGYGLSPEIAAVAIEMEPNLIITVDNGISSVEGIDLVKSAGIKVLVTDHHLPGKSLPEADAILNPNLAECEFPSKNLAGVGVLFYLMVGVRAALRKKNWFENSATTEPRLEDYLDLVALGTVADLVPLDRVNRILVTNGLKRMRIGNGNKGITALFEVSGRDISVAKSSDLAFAIGPRINAAGRLDDISEGINCLLAESSSLARDYALDLHHTNQARREIQDHMVENAEEMVAQVLSESSGSLPWGLCCYRSDWHQGVVGLVASKLKENLHRPAIAFAKADLSDGVGVETELKGSARSIEGVHMRDVLDTIASQNPGLIQKFGGHAMAAGLSIKSSDYEEFSACFDYHIRSIASEESLEQILWSDGELDQKDLTIDYARYLQQLLPWGQKIPEPSYHGRFQVESLRWLKDVHLKLRLLPMSESKRSSGSIDAIWFNANPVSQLDQGSEVTLLYRLDINSYRGQETLQLIISDEVELVVE